MIEKGSLFSKKSFREFISKVFKRPKPRIRPTKAISVDSEYSRKRLAKKAAGKKYRLKCLRRHQQKMIARRRKANKQARKLRRINRKRAAGICL